MDTLHCTLQSRKHKHLNMYERGQIQLLASEGLSAYAIGKRLGRASNTIRNELKRGTVTQIKGNKRVQIYYPDSGQSAYERNRSRSGTKFKYLTCQAFIAHAESLIRDKGYSVDAVCGSAKRHGSFKKHEMLSTKTLYNYIDLGLLTVSNIDLPLKTRRSTKSKRVRKHKKQLGRCISERPLIVNDRSEFGHWEIDTMIGLKTKGEPVLMTLTERKTRKEIIRKIAHKSSAAILKALVELATEAGEAFPQAFKSITSDNGAEFAELPAFEKQFGTQIYYAHPYTSSERGTNERHNGLIRRFIPKGKSLNKYALDSIIKIQNWCNTLPRKILDYMTPDEAFQDEIRILFH